MSAFSRLQHYAPMVGGALQWQWYDLCDDLPMSFKSEKYGGREYLPRDIVGASAWRVHGFPGGTVSGLTYWDARRELERRLGITRGKGQDARPVEPPSGHYGVSLRLDEVPVVVVSFPLGAERLARSYVEPSRTPGQVNAWFRCASPPKAPQVAATGALSVCGAGHREPMACRRLRRMSASQLEDLLEDLALLQ